MKQAGEKGLKISFNWLWSKARSIQRNLTGSGDASAVVGKHVITTFLGRHSIRMRSWQKDRTKPEEAFREDLMKWHSVTREHLIRAGAGSGSYDGTWGRFLPSQRFSLDQSPMPFVVDHKKTYEIMQPGDTYAKPWIRQPR